MSYGSSFVRFTCRPLYLLAVFIVSEDGESDNFFRLLPLVVGIHYHLEVHSVLLVTLVSTDFVKAVCIVASFCGLLPRD